jgi:hypothetical protein
MFLFFVKSAAILAIKLSEFSLHVFFLFIYDFPNFLEEIWNNLSCISITLLKLFMIVFVLLQNLL